MKKSKRNKKKKFHIQIAIVVIALLVSIITVFLIRNFTSNSEQDSIFKNGNATSLDNYDIKNANIDFLKEVAIDDKFYEDYSLDKHVPEDSFILYLYGDKCGSTCLNDNLLEELQSLQKSGEIIYALDYNRLSEMSLILLTSATLNHNGANILYYHNKQLINYVDVSSDSKFDRIPTSKNNSQEFLEGLKNTENKEEYLRTELKKQYKHYTEEEINDVINFYLNGTK